MKLSPSLGSVALFSAISVVAGCAAETSQATGDTSAADTTAASFTCATPLRAAEDASQKPQVTFGAQLAKSYKTGTELTQLDEVRVSAGRPNRGDTTLTSVAKDASYRPRGANKNWNRFQLGSIDAVDESFDGIVHSILLPKVLGAADIVSTAGTTPTIRAIIASSTDSYHDGIISYFTTTCALQEGATKDFVSCDTRAALLPEDQYGPSVSVSVSVDAAYKTAGAELVTLSSADISVAQAPAKHLASLTRDSAYRPRTNKNRVRINLDSIEASDDHFDGIVHGLLLPKTLPAGGAPFKAWVMSSTDSYHDGIISYFTMDCAFSR